MIFQPCHSREGGNPSGFLKKGIFRRGLINFNLTNYQYMLQLPLAAIAEGLRQHHYPTLRL
jgi:hypothetical protein